MASVYRVDRDHRRQPAENAEAEIVSDREDRAAQPIRHQLDHGRRAHSREARDQNGETELAQKDYENVGMVHHPKQRPTQHQ